MVVKTITVTEEAYNAVKWMKRANESFSELFLRVGRKPLMLSDLPEIGKRMGLTDEDAEAWKARIADARKRRVATHYRRTENVRARFKRAD